jgi:ribosomal-protein-alanine N-acetyltransferase
VTTLRFVPFNESHLPHVLRIDQACQSKPWSEQALRLELTRPEGVFLVALADGEVAGFSGAWMVLDEAHVVTVAVDPPLQRNRIGERMIAALLEACHKKGATCATLEVRASNEPAIALYKKFKFRDVARRRAYYTDNKEDAVVMWCDALAEVV